MLRSFFIVLEKFTKKLGTHTNFPKDKLTEAIKLTVIKVQHNVLVKKSEIYWRRTHALMVLEKRT